MANKKINQLVSKTAILSTDIFGIGDATTGQLFKKTIAELQAAIGGAVISVNGLVGTVVLDTDDIQELATPTNKYFTDARARGAISLTVTGNSGASTYSSGTGVLNVPTYTLAGLGGITASFLSGTSGISYNSTTGVISYSGTVYTDASIRALFSGSTGITYNSSTGAISYSGTVYTDSSVRALISMTTTGDSGASTYNNTTGVINVPNYTLAGLGGISLTSLSGGTGITYNSSTGAISYSGTVYTDASVRALFSASGSVSYNNTTGVISLTGGNLTEATSSVLTITGGSGAVIGGGTSIQVKQATTSVSGFLSSTDWTTFNNKQATVTLTTTGTSGAATFSANTLNIPNYGSALSGYLPLTGGTLTGALSGTSATFNHNDAPTIRVQRNGGTDSNTAMEFTNASRSFFIGSNGTVMGLGGTSGSIGAQPLQIASTGAATFSGEIKSGDTITLGAAAVGGFWTWGSTTAYLVAGTGKALNLNPNGTSGTTGLSIATTGAATFSSSVTAGGTITSTSSSGVSFLNANITTNNAYIRLVGSAHGFIVGREGSAGGQIFTGASAYASVIGSESTDPLQFATNNTVKMTITSAGNVEIGEYVYARKGTNGVSFTTSNGVSADWEVETTSGGLTYMGTSGNVMAINRNGGNVLIGTTSNNGEKLYVSGTIRATGTITANSDIILKKNLLKIENALEKVEQINGYTYEFKEDDSKRHAGVIAQEIQTVLPEIVNKGNDGILGVEYGNISALLIEAIKEQNIKIKNLETLLASK